MLDQNLWSQHWKIERRGIKGVEKPLKVRGNKKFAAIILIYPVKCEF
jgi:hypothetical protein